MPDIAMCKNKTCPSNELCYRYTATPKPRWQAYMSFSPDDSGKCDMFYPNEFSKEKDSERD
jgi:hypothetical protein